MTLIAAAVAAGAAAGAGDSAKPNPQRKAGALIELSEVVAGADPGRAAALAERAETVAHTITGPQQVEALARLTAVVAIFDIDRAETLAHTIAEPKQQANALAHLAGNIAGTDPERAARLADNAEAIARAITESGDHANSLTEIARNVAGFDPDRAETIAHSISHPWARDQALTGLAEALANTDPDRAETIARAITAQQEQAAVLTRLAAVVATDPDRDENLDRSGIAGAQSVIGIPAASLAEPVLRRSKRLLALAWSIARWEVPLPALPVVEPSVLRALASEVAGEHEF
ncbi:hypothetical protein [Nocardia asiatica]|uniref:hypothetical protein n=1 Tax=Nocardia asiatica TaxID=209252 RepID=UPI003EE110B8